MKILDFRVKAGHAIKNKNTTLSDMTWYQSTWRLGDLIQPHLQFSSVQATIRFDVTFLLTVGSSQQVLEKKLQAGVNITDHCFFLLTYLTFSPGINLLLNVWICF
jgi:hypothetical protein